MVPKQGYGERSRQHRQPTPSSVSFVVLQQRHLHRELGPLAVRVNRRVCDTREVPGDRLLRQLELERREQHGEDDLYRIALSAT